MSLTEIPDGFGAGGSNLSPECGPGSLRDVLREHVEAIDANTDKLTGVPAGNFAAAVAYSPVIDLTTTGDYEIVPPTPARFLRTAAFWEIKTVGGTRSVAPTFSIGSNAATFDNLYASQVGNAGLLSQAAETLVTPGTGVNPILALDLTASGLRIKITSGMTGSSPVCTARMVFMYYLVPV